MLWFLFLLFFFFLFLFKKISLRNNSFCSYGNVVETWLRMIMLPCWHPSAQKQCLMVNEWPGLNASPTALFVHAHALPLTILTQKNNLDWKLIGAVPFMVNWKMFGETLYLVLKRKQQIKCSQGGGGFLPWWNIVPSTNWENFRFENCRMLSAQFPMQQFICTIYS